MKKLMAVGLALLLMGACSAEETTVKDEKPVAKPKVEEKAEKPEPEAPTQSDGVAEYDAAIGELLDKLTVSMTDFSAIMFEGADPSVMITADYQVRLQSVCDRMYGEIQEYKSLNVPADREEVHARFIDALSHYEAVSTDTPAAVETMDVDRLLELTDEMTMGNLKLTELTADLPDLLF
jgi:hypothetical protein